MKPTRPNPVLLCDSGLLATMRIDNEPHYKEVLKQYPIPGVK
jgi:hypothetical protein